MRVKNYIFLACCLCVFCISVESAYGKAATCSSGEFIMSTQCRKCYAGCYCSGGGTETLSLDPKDKIKKSEVEKYCKHEANSCSHSGSDEYGACGRHDYAKMYRCSADYPNSAAGSTKSTECYWTCTSGTKYAGQTLYDVSYSCSSGKYLPKGSNDCADCPSDGKSICTGVSSYHKKCAGSSSDQGIKQCGSGEQPNSSKTGCEKKKETPKYKCIAGEYLPGNSEACAPCPAGKLCLGGTWEKRSIAQGDDGKCSGKDKIINDKGSACVPCPIGKKANETYTECVEGDPIKISAGYYLPANTITPKACTNARKFCPGGKFRMLAVDQGQYDCPSGGTVSSDKKSCILTLDKKQMRCGPNGTRKDSEQCISETPCWIKTDPEDYINCIYGVRFEVPTDESKSE